MKERHEFTLEDPRLTAYALGELDAGEARALEAAMSRDESLRRAVAEIRQTLTMIEDSGVFAGEELALTTDQRTRVRRQPEAANTDAGPKRRVLVPGLRLWAPALAAAAVMALAFGLGWFDRAAPISRQNETGPARQVLADQAKVEAQDAGALEKENQADVAAELEEAPLELAEAISPSASMDAVVEPVEAPLELAESASPAATVEERSALADAPAPETDSAPIEQTAKLRQRPAPAAPAPSPPVAAEPGRRSELATNPPAPPAEPNPVLAKKTAGSRAEPVQLGALIVSAQFQDGAPCVGAIIRVLGAERPRIATANAKGKAVFDDLEPGDYAITANHPEATGAAKMIQRLAVGQTLRVGLILTRPPEALTAIAERERADSRESRKDAEQKEWVVDSVESPVAELLVVGGNETDASRPQAAESPQPKKAFRAIGLSRFFAKKEKANGLRQEPMSPAESGRFNTEDYDHIEENAFVSTLDDPLSTFSIDVDTASYANVRRFLRQGALPPADAVRVEEMINYFNYDDPQPTGRHPFSVNVAVASAPWAPTHRLLRLGLKAKSIPASQRPAANLVFLLDVSGSMNAANKLPLLKQALGMLVENLTKRDRVSIVVYAGAAGVALEPTPGDNQQAILAALARLQAGGSTNGGAGIERAYALARKHFIEGGANRVILATDGDFNVGVADRGSLIRMIEDKAKTGVFLTVLGFGMGNLKDATLERLADKGNGAYAYIDTEAEARKALVEEIGGTLFTVAKDVKIQIEFNPLEVGAYRLIGYENRMLAHQDFNDDAKDAGEIGAGHSITALYELIPAGAEDAPKVDVLKYQSVTEATGAAVSGELLTVKLRYKRPDQDRSVLMETPVRDEGLEFAQAPQSLRFAAAVAAFGMKLRQSKRLGDFELEAIRDLAEDSVGADDHGYRAEFLELVETAQRLLDEGKQR